jgi:anthranilate phosphoribosyltransferase
MDFSTFIHAVGTGPKGNRDLTFDESRELMRQMLTREASPAQIAAFLLGWRIKPETTEEFRGALSVMDEMSVPQVLDEASVELGYPFDGKRHNPYIFPLVAEALEGHGLKLVVCGDEKQPAKDGITVKTVCEKLSLPEGVVYFDRAEYLRPLHELTGIRMRLGLRTAFNTLEKLPGIGGSETAITGVFHKPYVRKYVEIFGDRYKRFALLQGNEGTPELFSKGRLWIVHGDDVDEYIVDPARYGIDYEKSWERIGLEASLSQLENPVPSFRKLAKLNAAVLLFVSGKAADIDTAWERLED